MCHIRWNSKMQSGTVYLKDQEGFHKVTFKVTFQNLHILTAALVHYLWHMLVINKYLLNVIEHLATLLKDCRWLILVKNEILVLQPFIQGLSWTDLSSSAACPDLPPPNLSQWAPSLQTSSNPDRYTCPGFTCAQTKSGRKRDECRCPRWG